MESFPRVRSSERQDENIGLSPLRNKIAIALMSVLGALNAAGCSFVSTSVSHPGGSITVRNGRMEACSEDPSYVKSFQKDCREGTIETFTRGDEQCMRCDSK